MSGARPRCSSIHCRSVARGFALIAVFEGFFFMGREEVRKQIILLLGLSAGKNCEGVPKFPSRAVQCRGGRARHRVPAVPGGATLRRPDHSRSNDLRALAMGLGALGGTRHRRACAGSVICGALPTWRIIFGNPASPPVGYSRPIFKNPQSDLFFRRGHDRGFFYRDT